ncbi:MAG: PH domain-containing protein [Gemmatimonadales bacterium]|nr:PH domain-containing protein [Gemmatimonadales bacterium]MDZ4390099.1 PH domain-containing protein [Gemmatimonadales bacterium]
MARHFRSKIDAWLVIVFVSPLVLLAALIPSTDTGSPLLIFTVTVGLILGLGVWLVLTTAYTIEREELIVRCGPLTERVPLRSITAVSASRSLLSSPALSVDRLAIAYGKGARVLISPRDKQGFLTDLSNAGVPVDARPDDGSLPPVSATGSGSYRSGGPMHRLCLLAASVSLVTPLAGHISAQSDSGLACRDRRDDWQACALQAGGFPSLSSATVQPGQREFRYWVSVGIGVPHELLILRSNADSSTGLLLLIWPRKNFDSDLARTRCGQRWSNGTAGLCVSPQSGTRDWASIFRQLDEAGLAAVPGSPIQSQTCPKPTISPDGVWQDHLCAVYADGISEAIEVRTVESYWRYQFRVLPEPGDAALPRDRALQHILRCAVGWSDGSPC